MKKVVTRTTQKGQNLEIYVTPTMHIVAHLDGIEIATGYNIDPLPKPIGKFTRRVCGKIALTDAEATAIITAQEEALKADEAKIKANVPGLDILRAALADEERYAREFDKMMNDEFNDGLFPPKSVKVHYKDIAGNYPRAALYIRAEDYSCASHYAKVAAGDKALEIIKNGGGLQEAESLLDNWLPATAWFD